MQDGEVAYDSVYSDGYDVLILDWMMPRLSGIDLCKRLRDEEYQGKILMLTAKILLLIRCRVLMPVPMTTL